MFFVGGDCHDDHVGGTYGNFCGDNLITRYTLDRNNFGHHVDSR